MNKSVKKIIAREGLIFVPYFIIAIFYSYQAAITAIRKPSLAPADFISGIFWGRLFVWLFAYGVIRFIIWAVKSLREK